MLIFLVIFIAVGIGLWLLSFVPLAALAVQNLASSTFYFTLAAARLKRTSTSLQFAGAGHPPAMIVRQGQSPRLLASTTGARLIRRCRGLRIEHRNRSAEGRPRCHLHLWVDREFQFSAGDAWRGWP